MRTKRDFVVAAIVAAAATYVVASRFGCQGKENKRKDFELDQKVLSPDSALLERVQHSVDPGLNVPETNNNFLIVGSEKAAKNNIMRMEQVGALASVRLSVQDEMGEPVEGALVKMYFSQPELHDPAGRVFGTTDSDGRFSATKKTNYSCSWVVSKEGFHSAKGSVRFPTQYSRAPASVDRWTETPTEETVVLKMKSDAAFIRGLRHLSTSRIATNTWVGFDFWEGDCVPPFGRGEVSHLLFRLECDTILETPRGRFSEEKRRLSISAPQGGLGTFKEIPGSFSPFVPVAPGSFPTNRLVFLVHENRETVFEDTRPSQADYILFRTGPDSDAPNSFHVGILKLLYFSRASIQFEYFFNKEAGDLRSDADYETPRTVTR